MALEICGIEYNASAGIDISFKDVQPNVDQEIAGVKNILTHLENFAPICVVAMP